MRDQSFTPLEVDLTQKIQMHFPPNINPAILHAWNTCKAEVLTAELAKLFGKNPPVESLLENLGTVVVPAMPKQFIVKENFRLDTSEKAKVRISFLGDNLKKWFFTKIEEPRKTGSTVAYSRLKKNSVNKPIIAELGENKAVTTMAEIFFSLKKQGKGQEGKLLTNGYANIFYVLDDDGVLRAVSVGWDAGGWSVGADPVEYPFSWLGGCQVFSRNS